MDKFCDFFRKS